MTVKELREMLEKFDDDLIVEVKDDCGDYDEAQETYEDVEVYWDSNANWKAKVPPKTRKIVKIF